MNLYATLYDGVSLRKRLGTQVEFFEMLEPVQHVERLKPHAVAPVLENIRHKWVFESHAAPQMPGLEIRLRADMEEFTQKVFGEHYILS
jgi:hypothetical protein